MNLPSGFRLATAPCAFKYSDRDDLTLVLSAGPAVGAGVFTTNCFQAAPIVVAQEVLAQNSTGIRALIINAGQANACTGEQGVQQCRATLELLTDLGLQPQEILPASTGVIGQPLKMDRWAQGVQVLQKTLGQTTLAQAARAIMTTDTFPKIATQERQFSDSKIRLAGFAKGAGMICPQMATMLGFILCDAQVDPEWWQEVLTRCVDQSFNAITVDGDTSTNDCVLALANGYAGPVTDEELQDLETAVLKICQDLAYMIVQDAEGGTRVMRIQVTGAASKEDAQLAARAVGNSPLVKTALYGQDPNWGRIVAALGRSGAQFRPQQVRVAMAGWTIFDQGAPIQADWDSILAGALRRDQVDIDIHLGAGQAQTILWASDFTEEYIQINAQYRT